MEGITGVWLVSALLFTMTLSSVTASVGGTERTVTERLALNIWRLLLLAVGYYLMLNSVAGLLMTGLHL